MSQPNLDIHYSKKYLKRSLLKYSIGLSIWLGVFFIGVFPLLKSRHANIGEITHIVLAIILIIIFSAWSVKFVRILIECMRIFPSAPRIAYSLTNEGITSYQKKWFVSWEEVYDVATLIKNEGFCFRNGKKEIISINSWGIDPEEMNQVKSFILRKLSTDKTKRLK